MKKIIVIISTVLICVLMVTSNIFAAVPIRIIVNGSKVNLEDVESFVDEAGRIQVPVRFVSEALGAKVDWENTTQTVTINKGDRILTLKLGEKSMCLDGKVEELDTQILMQNGRVFVPVRLVSEALGATVKWDKDILTAYIEIHKTDQIVEINGYKVPEDTNIIINNLKDDNLRQTCITLNLLKGDWDKQLNDLSYALEQKFDESIKKEIISYINKKKKSTDILNGKVFKFNNQEILVSKSEKEEINIYIFIPHYKVKVSEY